ncbi:hypothetical protein BDK51DRAFT_32047 [Blyttiomyces helicus]|uniref:Uncharacterized protein n=1 Tax=Blyttiomyces helicus TaxID=388810 RepID=A0A4P9W5J0_9FUNG|nr:hypothetical protein BDK51DRAFT_32047 [Blyttiomyces helicus]|eukprot:RKO87679.1 hypothetical protein BDK51DRAFT_32047 [Blyttiomyces helicus]
MNEDDKEQKMKVMINLNKPCKGDSMLELNVEELEQKTRTQIKGAYVKGYKALPSEVKKHIENTFPDKFPKELDRNVYGKTQALGVINTQKFWYDERFLSLTKMKDVHFSYIICMELVLAQKPSPAAAIVKKTHYGESNERIKTCHIDTMGDESALAIQFNEKEMDQTHNYINYLNSNTPLMSLSNLVTNCNTAEKRLVEQSVFEI